MGGCLGQISYILQNLANEKIDDTELLEEVIYVFDNQSKTSDMDSGPPPPPVRTISEVWPLFLEGFPNAFCLNQSKQILRN